MGFHGLETLILVLPKLFVAWSLPCESGGRCQPTTHGCIPDRMVDCYPQNGVFLDLDYGYSPSGEKISAANCPSRNVSDIRLKELVVQYFYINPSYVKVCLNLSVTNLSGSSGCYKIRLLKRYNSPRTFYIDDLEETIVCINNIAIRSLDSYSIEVFPTPLANDYDEREFMLLRDLDGSIDGCASPEVKMKSSVCVKRYGAPANLSVTSTLCEDGAKRLNVSWNHREDRPIPDAYYVEIHDRSKQSRKQHFKVVNSTQIVLWNLNATFNYSARVLAYRRCSGLGVHEYMADTLGCGYGRRKQEVMLQDTCVYSTTNQQTLALTNALITTDTGRRIFSDTLSVAVSLMVVPCAMIIFISIGIVLLYISRNKTKISPLDYVSSDCMVFLFCSPSVSDSKLEYIHKNITANLTKYFHVITMEELVSGDISKWLEKTVNSVNVVLIVANKEFFNDWSSATRPPELYCMESLISAAVLQDAVTKFAFISTEDSTKNVCIPENSYLKLMQVFLMGTKINQEAELYHFVTKSRRITL